MDPAREELFKLPRVMPPKGKGTLRITEIFLSLQGEGVFIGVPTVFVRTAICNLRCSWCDSAYTFGPGKEMTLEAIIKEIQQHKVKHVCITGGEPLLQRETVTLIGRLLDLGYSMVLETGGSLSLEEVPTDERVSISLDVKCPSSRMQDKMLFENIEFLGPTDQLKMVIQDRADYEYAKGILEQYPVLAPVTLQPEGGKNLKNLAEWAMQDALDVRVLPQLHKWIWGDVPGH